MSSRLAFALLAGLALAATPTHAQNGIKYRVSMKMEMMGMSMPGQTHEVCSPPGGSSQQMIPVDKNCQISNYRSSCNRTTFDYSCTGADAMSGSGEFTVLGPDAYRGRMTASVEGQQMTMTFDGQKIGTCNAGEVPAAVRQAQAQMAQSCQQMLAGKPGELVLMHESFVGPRAMCAAQKTPYCSKVTQASQDLGVLLELHRMETAAGAAMAGRGQWQAYQACGLPRATVVSRACAKAQQAGDYTFIGALCPTLIAASCPKADANRHPDFIIDHCSARATQIASTCTARAFTADVASPNAGFCNRYAARRLQRRN